MTAGAEAPPPNLLIEVIVNGKPVSVAAGPIRDVIQQAIVDAGMFGAPIDQWELRTRDGDVIPHALPGGVEFALMGGQRLFLNLGLPPAVRAALSRAPEPDLEMLAEAWDRDAASSRTTNPTYAQTLTDCAKELRHVVRAARAGAEAPPPEEPK